MSKSRQKKRYWYAVFVGATPGVYSNHADAMQQVENFPKSDYLKFDSRKKAEAAFNERSRSDYDATKTFYWAPSPPIRR